MGSFATSSDLPAFVATTDATVEHLNRAGAMITGIGGVLVQPWRLLRHAAGYTFKWLVAYSALRGAAGGVLMRDYFVLVRRRLELTGLYEPAGPYFYSRGVHAQARIALLAGIAPRAPGLFTTVGLIKTALFRTNPCHYAWFPRLGICSAGLLALTLPPARRN